VEIVTDTKGYKAIDVAVVDSLTLLSGFADKVMSMIRSEITGKEKDSYVSYLNDATDEVKKGLFEKAEKAGGDAVYDIKINSVIQDIKGNTLLGAIAQCIVLKKEVNND